MRSKLTVCANHTQHRFYSFQLWDLYFAFFPYKQWSSRVLEEQKYFAKKPCGQSCLESVQFGCSRQIQHV